MLQMLHTCMYIVHVDAKRTFKNNNYLHVPQIETLKHNK